MTPSPMLFQLYHIWKSRIIRSSQYFIWPHVYMVTSTEPNHYLLVPRITADIFCFKSSQHTAVCFLGPSSIVSSSLETQVDQVIKFCLCLSRWNMLQPKSYKNIFGMRIQEVSGSECSFSFNSSRQISLSPVSMMVGQVFTSTAAAASRDLSNLIKVCVVRMHAALLTQNT